MSTENLKKKELAERMLSYKLRQHGLLDQKTITCILCGLDINSGDLFYNGISEFGHADCVDAILFPERLKNVNTGMSNCV